MNATFILYNVIAAIITITIHEFIKALISSSLGDPLPKRDRRVSLNPIRHIEPIGFIIMAAIGFGWGKPVETAAIYYKDRKKGTLLTYTIPSVANLLLGIIVYTILLLTRNLYSFEIGILLRTIALFNLRHAFFNIIPVYPLDGAKVLSALRNPNYVITMANRQIFLQMILVIAILWGFIPRVIDPICHAIFGFLARIYIGF